MKRYLDIAVSLFALVMLSIPMLLIALLVKFTSRGTVLYWSERVGKDNQIFYMPKFRTMRSGTPPMATHLMSNPGQFLTPVGGILRKTSLDELPQLVSILRGDMSLVGPRPALFNQYDLIEMRTLKGVHKILPGLTGWAQVNGRDDVSIHAKVAYDEHYLRTKSLAFDFKIIVLTFLQAIKGDGVAH